MTPTTLPDLQSGAATPPPTGAAPIVARVTTVLAVLMTLLPAVGVPGEWVLQDTLKSALLAAGTLAAAWVWLSARPTEMRWHGLMAIPALWMAYALGSMLWSHSYLAGVEAARWAVLGLLLAVGVQSLHPSNLMRLAWGIHLGAVAASAWAAGQFWADLQWFNQAAPPASTFVNRNFFAEFAVCALPFSALLLAQMETPRWRQLMGLSLGFNLVALLMTGTRSALGALMLMGPLLVYTLWRYRHQLAWYRWSPASRLSVALVFGLSIWSLGNLPSSHPETLGQTALHRSGQRTASMAGGTVYTEGSFAYRSMMWRGSARMLMDKPWTGVGAGAWEVFIPLYQGPSADEEPDYYAHNEYLQLLAEYGLPLGGGTLAVLFAYLLLSARNTWRLSPNSDQEAPLRAIALCSLLALLVVSLAGFPWRLATTGAFLMLNLAVLASSDARLRMRDALGNGRVGIGRWHRMALTSFLLLGSILAIAISTQAFRAETNIVGGIQALNRALSIRHTDPSMSEAARLQGVALLQEGIAINPHYRKIVSIGAEQLAHMGDWKNATSILNSIANSRPYVANVWANLVLANIEMKQPSAALSAWQELATLQPQAKRTRALEILTLRHGGQTGAASRKLLEYFSRGLVEYDLVRFALETGLETEDQALATQAYQLWVRNWPSEAPEQIAKLNQTPTAWRKGMQKKSQ